MEETLNQWVGDFKHSEIGQLLSNHADWLIFVVPLAYVIVCCIVSKSSEKRTYFYSYLDVLTLLLPLIVGAVLFAISMFSAPENRPSESLVMWALGITSSVTVIFTWIFSWRANHGSFSMALFMFIGKLMYLFMFVVILCASIVVSIYLLAFAETKMKRKKYQKSKSFKKQQVKVSSAVAVGGGTVACGLMHWGCKNHDFSTPPKLTKKIEPIESAELN